MTREEAINYLQPIADSASLPRYAEALNMAISALREQEEYEIKRHLKHFDILLQICSYGSKRRTRRMNDMRLGDLDALYQELSKDASHCLELGTKEGVSWATALQDAKRRIRAAPTIDAVPVVRCKDCKHYHAETGWCNVHSSFIDSHGAACHPWESSDWKMFEPEDFCSYGERKDGEG